MDRLARLDAFVRLAEGRSFVAVAEELGVKQSTVSKWLASLEDELGTTLIDRTTRARRITAAGERLHAHAQTILGTYERAVSELREADAVLRGRIRMSLPTVFGRIYVVPLVTELLTRHPLLEVELSLSDRYVSIVDEGYDVAIRIGLQIDSSLRSHALGESSRRLVASPRYLHKHGTPSVPRELEQHECLVHSEPGSQTLWRFTRGGTTYRARVRGRAAANHSEATRHMAREGLGIALLASWLVDDDIADGRLVPLLDPYLPPTAPIRALTPPGRHLPTRTRALLDHLREGLRARLG